jgi:hypothetical protein
MTRSCAHHTVLHCCQPQQQLLRLERWTSLALRQAASQSRELYCIAALHHPVPPTPEQGLAMSHRCVTPGGETEAAVFAWMISRNHLDSWLGRVSGCWFGCRSVVFCCRSRDPVMAGHLAHFFSCARIPWSIIALITCWPVVKRST